MEIIFLLIVRQLKRYFRSYGRVIGAVGQPILFLLALGYGFNPIYTKAGYGNYIQFLTPGVISMAIIFSSVSTGMEIMWDRQIGFLRAMLISPTPRIKIFLGRILGGSIIAIVQGLLILLVCLVAGFQFDLKMMPLAVCFMFLISLLFSALGIAIGSIAEDMHAFPVIINFIILPIFFFSGALFPVYDLSNTLKVIIHLNPLFYGINMLRIGFAGNDMSDLWFNFSIFILITSVLFFIANYFFSRIEL